MRALRDRVGESVHLYIRDEDTRICIAAVEARHELRPFIQLGRPLPLRLGAAGKVLLAFADESIQREELHRAASDAVRRPNAPGADLGRQLEQIRADGWSTSVGEREDGVAAIATKVVDSVGRVVAALGVSGPTTRLGRDGLEEMLDPLQEAAAGIGQALRRG
jgi:DNA-binding IclR family transcriptional regulator